MAKLRQKIKDAPTKPGCYLFKNKKGVVIYVGKAKNIKKRVITYFGKTKKEALSNLGEALELYFEDEPISRAEKIKRESVSVESLAYA